MAQVPSSAIIPYVGEEPTLTTPELKPDDLQDTTLTTIRDALTTLLEEELADKLAVGSIMVESAAVVDQIRSVDAEDRPVDATPTNPEVQVRTLFSFIVINHFELNSRLVAISLNILTILNRFPNKCIIFLQKFPIDTLFLAY